MAEEPVRPVKVWDGWIRLVHWGIVSLIGVSWVAMRTGNAQVHYLSGYTVLTLLLFRIAEIGHNAAGGWMVLVLLGLLLVQAGSGLFANHEPGMTYDVHGPLALSVSDATSAWLTGIHHLTFNLILAAAGLHVLAVLAYQVLKGQDLIGPMITGFKSLPARLAAPRMGSPLLAVAFLAGAALAVWGITRLG
jgi:cytochrome b